MSKFKIIVTAIFAICIVLGIGFFAMSKGKSASQSASITVWGTIPSEVFDAAYNNSSLKKNKQLTVTYVKKDKSDFDSAFVEALADGVGPDVVILREDSVYKNRNKLFVIPYNSYSERTFKDTFIEEGEMFLGQSGITAIPFIVDPMVMYWNRDMFSNNQIVSPPKYWDQIYDLINKLTKKDSSANVTQSALSFGEWSNVSNAKELISMLMIQAGTPISKRTGDTFGTVMNSSFNYSIPPSQSAMNFYTQFANPTAQYYSWNRSLPTSLNYFISGNLAIYFGFASEIYSIQQKNPNLNFDVAMIPQVRDGEKNSVFGHLYTLALVKQSKNISAGFSVISGLTEASAIKATEGVNNLPPVRRDLLSGKPTDAFKSVFYNSALISKSWVDPNPDETSKIFRNMIESITSGKMRVNSALSDANNQLDILFR